MLDRESGGKSRQFVRFGLEKYKSLAKFLTRICKIVYKVYNSNDTQQKRFFEIDRNSLRKN